MRLKYSNKEDTVTPCCSRLRHAEEVDDGSRGTGEGGEREEIVMGNHTRNDSERRAFGRARGSESPGIIAFNESSIGV